MPSYLKTLPFLTLALVLVLSLPQCALAAEETGGSESQAGTDTEFRLRARPIPKESIFDITFGSPPPLATERGILIIDAYYDKNGNSKRDEDETDLTDAITCRVGEIDYSVPAFVPGLSYNETYAIACLGKGYQPQFDEPDVFIGKRGQVITVDLPCTRVAEAAPGADTESGGK